MGFLRRKAEPFVGEVALRREVLDDAVVELQTLSYAQLLEMTGQQCTKQVTGRDNKVDTLRIMIDRRRTGRAPVTVQLSGGGWLKPRLTERFEMPSAIAGTA